MAPLKIEPSEDTPKIILDSQNGIFEIQGRSLPEDATHFYGPIMEWISTYAMNPNPKTIFNFSLEYFNTASAKQILKILNSLEKVAGTNDVVVKWYYEKADLDMKASGERYSKLVNLKIELQEIK